MQIAYSNEKVYLKDVLQRDLDKVKKIGFTYNKSLKVFEGLPSIALINELSSFVKLPDNLIQLKNSLETVQKSVDTARLDNRPKALMQPPIKANLFEHQIRALNMILLHFQIVEEH